MKSNENVHCSCGEVGYQVTGQPVMRLFCHCTICQSVNKAPYADITLFKAKDVVAPSSINVDYKAHTFPPILQRGKCVSCDKIAVEYLTLIPMSKVAIIPSDNIDNKELLPDASFHMFYDTRMADVNDHLPKYQGYLKSQSAFARKLISSLIGSK